MGLPASSLKRTVSRILKSLLVVDVETEALHARLIVQGSAAWTPI